MDGATGSTLSGRLRSGTSKSAFEFDLATENSDLTGKGYLDTARRTGRLSLSDGRSVLFDDLSWAGKSGESGAAWGRDDRSNGILLAISDNPYFFHHFFSTISVADVNRGPVSSSDRSNTNADDEALRIRQDWYFYTAEPRTESERLWRDWVKGMTTSIYNRVRSNPGEGDSEIVFYAVHDNEEIERKLRNAMRAVPFTAATVDRFLALEKAEMLKGVSDVRRLAK